MKMCGVCGMDGGRAMCFLLCSLYIEKFYRVGVGKENIEEKRKYPQY